MKINDELITQTLEAAQNAAPQQVREILQRARALKGVSFTETAALLAVTDKQLLNEIFETAKFIKTEIYGNRLVLFAPLYISNLCNNECAYCAFRVSNRALKRRALTQDEVKAETLELIRQGHKRVLLVAGESYTGKGLQYVFDAVKSVYSVKDGKNNIRRVNVNIAPLTTEEFRQLKQYNIGTFQLFQETYHKPTYESLHTAGPKKDYDFRLNAMHRALEAGLNDVGIGILFGLYNYKYEVLAMLQHIKDLEDTYGVGPHTISVPRIEPAAGSELSERPPHAVSDEDFKKIIAVLRIAVPYTGIILSTRENAQTRRDAFDLGISQISAGSKTNPGGYENKEAGEQFSLGDHRTLAQVTDDMVSHGYIPSFCTGCYRLGRVGKDFMDLAKPGLIKIHCLPNAMFTFAEYLYDFADDNLREKGFALIDKMISDLPPQVKENTLERLKEIAAGKRDVYF
ncbi:MAG: [FeFe] hydrogenase H-cluster radical SAM maturase HydG [Elusimicrobiota bacterium]|jgi:2-iminoacetate synthase|nr:[FeFe] hydrogenase H-cluster radical SAM maturase HydG [Elusimicrobiota bacterium]